MCSDKYFNINKAEWLTFLPCVYDSDKCGSLTQILTLDNSQKKISTAKLDVGDICMYELQYSGTNNDFRLWFDSINRAEITLIDGIRTHPWLDQNVFKENFVNRSMTSDDDHEFGDELYKF
jgi:hypothetical protein